MILAYDNRSSSESDEDDIYAWSVKKRKNNNDQKVNISNVQTAHSQNTQKDKPNEPDLTNQCKKFDELKNKFTDIRTFSALRSRRVEERKSKRLVKKALRDPAIKKAVEDLGNAFTSESVASGNEEVKWDDIKPLLTVNDHLQGPVSHGDFGPKYCSLPILFL
ncbi:uncharacterized protein LOC118204483 [Stegodyphus dumicola]|uniref:uncharacterized protein LOC118204483 n=1 Tax=Stegodyphus dumicola TaxID=202533 RepID=UPI0015A93205|nr:uncharacterized protein LOC118204483 [Stegodyphus dumicola]